MRRKILLWALLLIAVFLIGYVPSYWRARNLNQEVDAARQEISQLRLRDAIGRVYFEASEKNYGRAKEASVRFFDQARQLKDRTENAGLKQSLQQMLDAQQTISFKLGQADPAVLNDLARLYRQTQQATGGA